MKRFKTIDWFNIIAPMLLGVLLAFQFGAWWLLLIVAGLLYGSFMWRMTAVVEELNLAAKKFNRAANRIL